MREDVCACMCGGLVSPMNEVWVGLCLEQAVILLAASRHRTHPCEVDLLAGHPEVGTVSGMRVEYVQPCCRRLCQPDLEWVIVLQKLLQVIHPEQQIQDAFATATFPSRTYLKQFDLNIER